MSRRKELSKDDSLENVLQRIRDSRAEQHKKWDAGDWEQFPSESPFKVPEFVAAHTSGVPGYVAYADLTNALVLIRALRLELDVAEERVLEAARKFDIPWDDLAEAMGCNSKQHAFGVTKALNKTVRAAEERGVIERRYTRTIAAAADGRLVLTTERLVAIARLLLKHRSAFARFEDRLWLEDLAADLEDYDPGQTMPTSFPACVRNTLSEIRSLVAQGRLATCPDAITTVMAEVLGDPPRIMIN